MAEALATVWAMAAQYRPIRKWGDLPSGSPAALSETLALEFKAQHSPEPGEIAKDIAAFANAFGGTILVGVGEKADTFTRRLLPVDATQQVIRAYEDACRELLAPRPLIDAVAIACPSEGTGAIVAVNVEPFPGQPVGARLPQTTAWRFPIRTASKHTAYLDPETFMIHSDARTRKAAILLAAVPPGPNSPVLVQIMQRVDLDEVFSNTEVLLSGELRSLDVATNTATLRVQLEDASQNVSIAVPLEDVEAVWKNSPFWTLRLNGALRFHRGSDGYPHVDYMSGRGPFEWGTTRTTL